MIRIENLSVGYEGEEKLFSSLCLTMERKRPVLILSDPGCGKTSLAKALCGVGTRFYSMNVEGSFSYDSLDLLSLGVPERRSYVARSIQNVDEAVLFPTVSDEVAFPLEQRMLGRDVIEKELSSLLERYDLVRYHDADTSELSGGEKRRLNLAALDAVAPRLFIYDEAFDDLSSSWRKRLLSIMREKEYVLTLGSHYLKEYDGFFEEVYEIRDKKLVPYEKKEVFFSFPSPLEGGRHHALSIENVIYSQTHKAMKEDNVFTLRVSSMTIESGMAYLLEGENGAGKSTFARLLTGLVDADGGVISFDSVPIKARERRRCVSYLFQNPFNQLYLPRVEDELMSVAKDRREVERTASLFSLELDDYTQELSYGKAKMLQAAIYYILDRPFVVFDEVDSAISYQDTMKMLSLFMEKGAGVLMISHDERIKSAFKGKAYHMQGGLIR
ncbi:MAG TPA: ATP-binding cassette domain-containing protein [Candidatus Ornithospirochaeta stercorigallinarum]|nr:ATP-binding cassette domain-containing protein [Candidatus Ornithospirochaeta stercorigallinarum]